MFELVRTLACDGAEAIFRFICHQHQTDLWPGVHVALCPRCIGLQLSAALTLVMTVPRGVRPSRLSCSLVALAASIAPLHWLLGFARLIEPSAIDRLVTGAISGAAMASLAVRYARAIGLRHFPGYAARYPAWALSTLVGLVLLISSADIALAINIAAVTSLVVNASVIAVITRQLCVQILGSAISSTRQSPLSFSKVPS